MLTRDSLVDIYYKTCDNFNVVANWYIFCAPSGIVVRSGFECRSDAGDHGVLLPPAVKGREGKEGVGLAQIKLLPSPN